MIYAPILAVDFDGTIVDHEFPNIGKLKPRAKEVLQNLHSWGCRIIIWTCRDGVYLQEALKFLRTHDIPYDCVNCNIPEIDFTSNKIFANYYIDDLNLGGFPGWNEVQKAVLADRYFTRKEQE